MLNGEIRLKGWLNVSINCQKVAFGNTINKNNYVPGINILLEINLQWKLSKSVGGKMNSKGWFF